MSTAAVVTGKHAGSLRGARLPKWAPLAIAAVSIALGLGISAAAGLHSKIQWALIAALLHVVGTYGVAARVEGRRQAKDRVATSLVWVAFLLAVVPRASPVWGTVRRGGKVQDI
jgi:phosphate transport system permease protein